MAGAQATNRANGRDWKKLWIESSLTWLDQNPGKMVAKKWMERHLVIGLPQSPTAFDCWDVFKHRLDRAEGLPSMYIASWLQWAWDKTEAWQQIIQNMSGPGYVKLFEAAAGVRDGGPMKHWQKVFLESLRQEQLATMTLETKKFFLTHSDKDVRLGMIKVLSERAVEPKNSAIKY